MSHDPGRSRPDRDVTAVPAAGLEPLEPRLLLSASPLEPQEAFGSSIEQPLEAPAAVGVQTFGIDVSKWQGAINWGSVAGSGIEFVWAKATEGVNFVDSRWSINVNGANNAGLPVSGYHFATPYTGGVNDAAAEASDFYDAVSPYLGDGFLRPALDLESGSSLSTTVLSNWVHDFMNAFSALSSGIVPIIYMNGSFASSEINSSVNIYDLWYANPTNNPSNPPSAPGVFSSYDLWQYSWTTSVPGIAGNVDGNVFLGDLAQFTAKYVINTIPDDHGDDLASATPIAMPSTTAGVIEAPLDADWFEVSLTSGVNYTFSTLADGLTSAELRLYTSGGALLATDTGPAVGSTLAELTFTPIAVDTYFLEVTSSDTGGYDLVVEPTDDVGDSIAEAATLLGPFAAAGIQTSGDVDFFRWHVDAGTNYSFKVSDSSIADATLTLYDAVGAVISQNTGSNPGGVHAQVDWTAPTTGDVYLAVSANPGTTGAYLLTIETVVLEGDLNGDGFVGIEDLNLVLSDWNASPPTDPAADPTGDNFVGIEDLNLVLGNWNAGTPPPVTAIATSVTLEPDAAAPVLTDTAVTTTSEPQPSRGRPQAIPAAPARTDRAQGLAIAAWQASSRSPFGDAFTAGGSSFAPVLGLWESSDDDEV